MTRQSDLREAVRDAARTIRNGTGASAWNHFDDGPIDSSGSQGEVRHALGLIEGAAIALGLTPLELLDELGIGEDE